MLKEEKVTYTVYMWDNFLTNNGLQIKFKINGDPSLNYLYRSQYIQLKY